MINHGLRPIADKHRNRLNLQIIKFRYTPGAGRFCLNAKVGHREVNVYVGL